MDFIFYVYRDILIYKILKKRFIEMTNLYFRI